MPGFGFGCAIDRNLARGSAGGAPVATVTTGIAANRGHIPLKTMSLTLPATSRTEHTASPQGAISDLRIILSNWFYSQTTFRETAGPSAFTIKMFVEYPAGTFTAATFSAAATVNVTAGNSVATDPVPVSIPAGARFWVRTVVTAITSGSLIPGWQIGGIPNIVGLSDGVASGDLGNSGTINPSTTGNIFGPTAIMGTVTGVGNSGRGFVLIGDSIVQGTGDTAGIGAKGGSGYLQRALDPLYPWISIACPGGTIAGMLFATTRLSALLNSINIRGGFSHVITEHAVNDLKTSGGRTVAQVEADHQTLYTLIKGIRPSALIYPVTQIPWATSATSNWTVAPGDQVPSVQGNWPNHPTLNANIRAGRAQTAGFIEAGDFAASARDSGFWAGRTPQWTNDGIHPSTAGAAGIAAVISIP